MTSTKLTDGLYVTTQPLPGAEQAIGAGLLVWLSSPGPGRQTLRLPARQERNRWVFQDKTYPVRSDAYARTLQPLPPEGLYVTTAPLPVTADWTIPPRSLAALSYSLHAQPILYLARPDGPHIHIPAIGYRFAPEILTLLKPADFTFSPLPTDTRPALH